MFEKAFALVCGLTLFSCATPSQAPNKTPKSVKKDTPLPVMIESAVVYGGITMQNTKRILRQNKAETKAQDYLLKNISSNYARMSSPRLINSINLLLWTKPQNLEGLFKKLLASNKVVHNQLGWHIASMAPTEAMKSAIDGVLSDKIIENSMTGLFVPKMAEAVSANNLKSAYTLLRQGLFESNHVAFVHAMIELDRRRSSIDFMDYLSLAPLEELRQLNLSSIDVFSASAILQHLASSPAPVNHRHVEFLFYYSISRNQALAELGQQALSAYLPENQKALAITLGRLPGWIQIAFVERMKRTMTPVLSLFSVS